MILPSARAVRVAAILAAGSLLGCLVPIVGWCCVAALAGLAALVALEGLRLPERPVSYRRALSARLSINETETVTEEVQNLLSMDLEIRLAVAGDANLSVTPLISSTTVLPSRGKARMEFQVLGARRGEAKLGRPMLRYSRPRGLACKQIPLGEVTVVKVFPNLARIKRYEALRRARALSAFGIHQVRYGGLGTEYDHLRAYSRDDDYRRIHWKATARKGMPITQVVRAERGQSVLLAVDTSHWMGISAGEMSRLDFAVDAALFLAHVAKESGDRVGLALFADEVLEYLAPGSKPGQVRRIVESLYRAHSIPVHPSYRNFSRHVLSRRERPSLVVLLTEPPDDDSAGELISASAALRPRHLPLIVGFKDPALVAAAEKPPESTHDFCCRLAARELLDERQQHLLERRKRGLLSLDVLPSQLSVSLINRYLELKN